MGEGGGVSKCTANAKPLQLFLMKLYLGVELRLIYVFVYFCGEKTLKFKFSLKLHLTCIVAMTWQQQFCPAARWVNRFLLA